MKLYDCKIAPSPRRVRIFLAEKGIEMEKVEIDLITAENLKPPFLAINPRGQVPTLELDDGTRIDETMAICRYLEALYPDPPLMGTDPKDRAIVESRTRHMEIDGFIAVAEAFRNTSPGFVGRSLQGVPEDVPQIPELAKRGLATIGRFYDALEKHLARNEFVAGERFTLADITALTSIDFAGWVSANIPETHTNLKRWYAATVARPSAQA